MFRCCLRPLERQHISTSQVCATELVSQGRLNQHTGDAELCKSVRAVQPEGRQFQKSGARRSFCSACICSTMLRQGLVMAPDTCGTAFARLHRLWVVLQILDLLLILMADAAALHCLSGRHIKGNNHLMQIQLHLCCIHTHCSASVAGPNTKPVPERVGR